MSQLSKFVNKTYSVILSCQTAEQLRVAEVYASRSIGLYRNNFGNAGLIYYGVKIERCIGFVLGKIKYKNDQCNTEIKKGE